MSVMLTPRDIEEQLRREAYNTQQAALRSMPKAANGLYLPRALKEEIAAKIAAAARVPRRPLVPTPLGEALLRRARLAELRASNQLVPVRVGNTVYAVRASQMLEFTLRMQLDENYRRGGKRVAP